MRLRSLDLFSGCGGITHALRDFADPVMYCEIAPVPYRMLRALMARGALPAAPVHRDVSTLDGAALRGKVDLIAGGFPCVGVSTAGLRQGLAHPGTGLFEHIVRLAREIEPPFVFLENVAAITEPRHEPGEDGDPVLHAVVRRLSEVGYRVQWVVLPAYQVGSPMMRARWFALCHRGPGPVLDFPPWRGFDWGAAAEPSPRMVPPADSARLRIKTLGNSVVPDCVTLAFRMLWTGLAGVEAAMATGPVPLAEPDGAPPKRGSLRYGAAEGGAPAPVAPPPGLAAKPHRGILLDPGVFPPEAGYVPPPNAAVIQQPVTVPLWPSPRYGNGWRGAKTLTRRGRGDLGTVSRFAVDTVGPRDGYVNPEFAEWLMGYPAGWTHLPPEEPADAGTPLEPAPSS